MQPRDTRDSHAYQPQNDVNFQPPPLRSKGAVKEHWNADILKEGFSNLFHLRKYVMIEFVFIWIQNYWPLHFFIKYETRTVSLRIESKLENCLNI